MRWPAAALLVAALLALVPVPSSAQPSGPDATRARELFERGVQLMQNEDWGAALVQLEESFRLRPTQVALFNMGLCNKGLRRYGAAIRAFERLILEFGDRGSANRVELARAELANLYALLGHVEVVVEPAGAEVLVDGAPVGVAPLAEPLELAAGNHVLAARREGFQPAEQAVAVIAGARATVRLALPPVEPAPPAPAPTPPEVAPTPPPRHAAPPATVPPDARGWRPIWFWSAVSLSAVGAISTAILGGLVVAGDRDYRDSRVRLAAEREDGKRLALFADVALGVTLLAAVGAVLAYGRTDFGEPSPSPVTVALAAAPGSYTLSVSGAFR